MDIRGGRRSTNVEDRRGMRIGRTGAGIGIGGVAIAIVLSLLGINPLPFLEMTQQGSQVEMQPGDQPYQESAQEAEYRQLAEVVLGETETTWGQQFGGQDQDEEAEGQDAQETARFLWAMRVPLRIVHDFSFFRPYVVPDEAEPTGFARASTVLAREAKPPGRLPHKGQSGVDFAPPFLHKPAS